MIKKLSISLLGVALIAMLVGGATFALFTASSASLSNTFTAGTVSLNGPAATDVISISNLAPGDTGSKDFTVTYTGNLDAYLGMDIATSGDIFKDNLNSTMGEAGLDYAFDIYNGAAATGTPAKTIKEDDQTFKDNCTVDNILLGTVKQNDSYTVHTRYGMELNTPNEYQGKSGSITLLFHAVQQANNPPLADGSPTYWDNNGVPSTGGIN